MTDLNPITRRPGWAWLLTGFCFLIAVAAVKSQWILGLFGRGAGLTVMNIAKSHERTERERFVACVGITVASWVAFAIASFAIARLR